MQMGEKDSAYHRNSNVVESHLNMNCLQEQHGEYIHELYQNPVLITAGKTMTGEDCLVQRSRILWRGCL